MKPFVRSARLFFVMCRGVVLLAAATAVFAASAHAQDPAEQPHVFNPFAPTPPAASGTKAPKPSKPGPTTVEERNKILADLYRRLSEADDPAHAVLIETAIEKLWRFSGSDTIDLLMQRALKMNARKNTDLSVKLFGAVTRLAPQYAEGWSQRAFLYFKQKKYAKALGDIRHVLVLDPKHFKAIGGLGVIMRELGDDAAALAAFRKALAVHPLDADTKRQVRELRLTVEGKDI